VDEERPSVHRQSSQALAASTGIALHPSASKPDVPEGAIVANTYLVMSEGVEPLSSMPYRVHHSL
jgi:hypothetical protein